MYITTFCIFAFLLIGLGCKSRTQSQDSELLALGTVDGPVLFWTSKSAEIPLIEGVGCYRCDANESNIRNCLRANVQDLDGSLSPALLSEERILSELKIEPKNREDWTKVRDGLKTSDIRQIINPELLQYYQKILGLFNKTYPGSSCELSAKSGLRVGGFSTLDSKGKSTPSLYKHLLNGGGIKIALKDLDLATAMKWANLEKQKYQSCANVGFQSGKMCCSDCRKAGKDAPQCPMMAEFKDSFCTLNICTDRGLEINKFYLSMRATAESLRTMERINKDKPSQFFGVALVDPSNPSPNSAFPNLSLTCTRFFTPDKPEKEVTIEDVQEYFGSSILLLPE